MLKVGTRVLLLCVIAGLILFGHDPAQSAEKQEGSYGFSVNRPVIAAACLHCPYGSLAEIVKNAMKDTKYDLRICYECAGPTGATLVADKLPPPKRPPAAAANAETFKVRPQNPPSPEAPIDVGINNPMWLRWTYEGSHGFNAGKAKNNLRVIATVQYPRYLIVAAKRESGITDLAQLRGKPVRIIAGYMMEPAVLEYFGLTKENVEKAGGAILASGNQAARDNFDVIVMGGTLNNTPEFDVWYEASQKHDLQYIRLPDELLNRLAKDYGWERVSIPSGLMRGVTEAIPSIGMNGTTIFGRDDTPDDFAYTLARELDAHQDLLAWNMDFTSYNPHNVWKTSGVPLHPGAARYYKEKGYMK